MANISVVINTWNEEENLPRALASIKSLADEIIVVDMESTDRTVEIAKKEGAKVYSHKPTGYVEPARNFAIRQAQGEHILVLDADEEIPPRLARKLKQLAAKLRADFYRIPRKNIIFGKWIKYTRWWPDYNIRFFKKGTVSWSEVIHSVPETKGEGQDLPAQEKFAIIHHNYNSISQYLERLVRYTDIQAKEKTKSGYNFSWKDLISKPTGEFISRFLVSEGYKDGVHGLALSLLQAVSELVLYLKVWELQKFKEENLNPEGIKDELTKSAKEIDHWMVQTGIKRYSTLDRLFKKVLK